MSTVGTDRGRNLVPFSFFPEVDEWEVAGVTPAPCEDVRPERIVECPVSLECRVREVVELGSEEMPSNSLVIGGVTRIHVVDEAMDGFMPRPEALDLVGRLGGSLWAVLAGPTLEPGSRKVRSNPPVMASPEVDSSP